MLGTTHTHTHTHTQETVQVQGDERKDVAKELGDILGDGFMQTKVGKGFKDRGVKMITKKKTGRKNLSFKLYKPELLEG